MLRTIGITDCDKWANYESWIKSIATNINVVRLKASEDSAGQVSLCCGIKRISFQGSWASRS